MNERFDDMIRRRLNGHESEVPDDMFDAIRNRPEVQDAFFDNAVRTELANAESMVPAGMFDKIADAADLSNLAFDSSIKNKIEDYESEVPADMWQRIIQEKERRRRPIAWWWMAAALLLFICVGLAVYFKVKDEKQLAKGEINKENKTISEQSVQNTASDSSRDDISGTDSNSTGEEDYLFPNRKATTNASTSTSIDKVDTYNTNTKPSRSFEYTSKQNRKHKPTANAQTEAGFFPASAKNKKQTSYYTENDNLTYSTATPENIGDDLTIAHLSILELMRNEAKFSPKQLLQAKAHAPVIPCPTTGDENRNDWYVDVYSSALMLNKKISDKVAGKGAQKGFDSTLHQQVSFNVGVNLVKTLGENFLLKTGLQYNRINEAFRTTRVNERRIVTTISVRSVILSTGDTVLIRDTSTVEQIGTLQRARQNTYTQWDVPIILGYEFGGKGLRLNANVGLIANIRSGYKGEMLDTLQKFTDINNFNGGSIYRKNIGFSLYAGLSILKTLNSRTSLLIEPHARFGLSNTASNQAWFIQKNNLYGISIGIRYKLNNNRQRIY